MSIFWAEREVFFFSPSLLPSFLPLLHSPPSLAPFTLSSLSPSRLFLSETNYVGLRLRSKEQKTLYFSPSFPLLDACISMCVCVFVRVCVCSEEGKKLGARPRCPQSCKDLLLLIFLIRVFPLVSICRNVTL